jgi:type IV pilus assembly protein PilY1
LHNGKWGVVFGNGYNNTAADGNQSTTGDAVLFILDAQTGKLIKKIDTGVGSAKDPTKRGRPNGLAEVFTLDYDNDSIIDDIYAGDLYGNLWKFNLTDASPDNWGSAYMDGTTPVPLFTARNDSKDPTLQVQPITTKPIVVRGPNGVGLVVMFGTGKYLEPSDTNPSNLVTQSYYGIFDPNTNTASDIVSGRAELTAQTIVFEGPVSVTAPDGSTTQQNMRAASNNATTSSRGWYMDLVSPVNGFQGEMVTTDSKVDNGMVIFSTLIPNADPCSGGGSSWLMTLNIYSGGRLDFTPFDLNGDGKFTSSDFVTITLPDGTKMPVPVSGTGMDSIQSSPTILFSNDTAAGGTASGRDLMLTNDANGKKNGKPINGGPRHVGRQSWRQVR